MATVIGGTGFEDCGLAVECTIPADRATVVVVTCEGEPARSPVMGVAVYEPDPSGAPERPLSGHALFGTWRGRCKRRLMAYVRTNRDAVPNETGQEPDHRELASRIRSEYRI